MSLAPATRRALAREQFDRLSELQQTASSYAPDTVQHRALRDLSRHFTEMCSSLPDPSSETRKTMRQEIEQKTAIAKSEYATELSLEQRVKMGTYLDQQLSYVAAADSTFGRDVLPDDVKVMSQALRHEVGKLDQLSSAVGAVRYPNIIRRLPAKNIPYLLQVAGSSRMTGDSWRRETEISKARLKGMLEGAVGELRTRTSVDTICGDGPPMHSDVHSVLVKTLEKAEILESIVEGLRGN